MNCWEYTNCGYEAGGPRASHEGTCPAYPAFGKHCARVDGTKCGGSMDKAYVVKLVKCMKCDYYNSRHYDRNYHGISSDKHCGGPKTFKH